MTRHPASRRTHAQPAAAEDAVVATMVEASTWARRHSRALITGVIVLAIGVFAAISYANYRSDLKARATSELIQVRQAAATGDIPAAVTQLDGFITRFDGTPAASEARLLLAQLQLAQGNAAQAAEAIRPVAEVDDPILSASAGLLLAGAYETSGQTEQAEQAYLAVAETAAMDFQRREALEDAARIRVAAGNITGAVELYDRLIAMTEEGSPARNIYEMRRAEITVSGS